MQVEFRGVTKRYGKVIAVDNLNLTIAHGALHFLLGPSGCGKTTTLRMLAGLESLSEGQLLFDQKDVSHLPAAARGIGMVFQNYALWPHMTVRRNIEYGLKVKRLARETIEERLQEVLALTQLEPYADRLPGQLSGGQQQRVALARALAIRPSVLLLDEPLSNLDAKLRLEMRDNISRIHKQTGITTIYVTHDQKEALSMGTEISVMRAGKLVQSGSPRELYNRPQDDFIAGFVGETNLITGQVTQVSSSGEAQVTTELGTMTAHASGKDFNVRSGQDICLSIRPESVRILWDSQTNLPNTFHMTLGHLTYLGEVEQFNLNTGRTALKSTVFHPPEHSFKEGDRISFHVKPTDVIMLPRSI